jgi:hypothetical protein
VGADDETISPALGALELRRPTRDELAELGHEAIKIGRSWRAEFGVDRERQETSALLVRASLHAAHFSNDAGGSVDQMFGGEAILRGAEGGALGRRWRRPSHQCGVDDERARAGHEDALDAPPALPVLDELEQSGFLECTQVVVDALAPEREIGGELGRR